VKDIVGINVPLFVSTVNSRVTTLCVSEGFSGRDIADLGFIACQSVQDALRRAFELVGQEAAVGIIPYCGETLVKVEEA